MRLECRAILFDLDGVLVDSAVCVERHWREWADKHGLDFAAIMRVAHGQKTVDTMRLFAPDLDVEAEASQFAEWESSDVEGVYSVPGAADLVGRLPADAWAVVTSGNRRLALARIHQAGLPVPPTLVTADDVTQGKPAPDPYLVAAARVGVDPRACIAIEDSPPGIESARAAGMRVLGLATTHSREELVGCEAAVDRLELLRVNVQTGAEVRLIFDLA